MEKYNPRKLVLIRDDADTLSYVVRYDKTNALGRVSLLPTGWEARDSVGMHKKTFTSIDEAVEHLMQLHREAN